MIRPACLFASLALAALLYRPAFAHPAAFTIEEALQAPYPSDLLAAPAGGRIAWVFDEKGRRNIWVADSKGGTPHAVTALDEDGVDIGQLAWSPDGNAIAFTRGQALEDEKPANVSNSPAGPSGREVWVVPVQGGPAVKVGPGHRPSFAPDGSRLVYLDRGHLFEAAPSGQPAAAPLLTDANVLSTVIWAPDGKRLAFVSDRGSHSVIGLYDLAAKTIVWASPSLDRDESPVFSPDGKQLAFIRVPSGKRPVFISRRSGQPWSIWVADAGTGAGRRVWLADPGKGSEFHNTLSEQNLLWTAQDKLVFPWEKTGWLQLYTVSARGGAAQAMTEGAFEVAHMALNADRTRLAFSSNQEDGDRMHVWIAASGQGKPVRAGEGSFIESFPQWTSDGSLFALQSGADSPLQPARFAGKRWEGLLHPSFPSAKLVTPQAVVFPAKDSQDSHGQLFLPRDGGGGTHPAILFFHGGPRRQMLLGFHPMGAYNWMYAFNQYLTSKGYVVLSVNYRGGIGYGLDYREAEDFGPGGGSELNDLLGAVAYLKSRKDVDVRRIGI